MCMSFNQYEPRVSMATTRAIKVIAIRDSGCRRTRPARTSAAGVASRVSTSRRALGATASAQRARPARRPVLLDRLALNERSELRARPRDLRVKTRLLTLECGEALSR